MKTILGVNFLVLLLLLGCGLDQIKSKKLKYYYLKHYVQDDILDTIKMRPNKFGVKDEVCVTDTFIIGTEAHSLRICSSPDNFQKKKFIWFEMDTIGVIYSYDQPYQTESMVLQSNDEEFNQLIEKAVEFISERYVPEVPVVDTTRKLIKAVPFTPPTEGAGRKMIR